MLIINCYSFYEKKYSTSIQYGIGILQAIQNESKSQKKSLKVIIMDFFCFDCRSVIW